MNSTRQLDRENLERWLFIAFTVAIVYVVFRGQSDTIRLREFVNPDEGNLMAAGRRAAMSFIPFKDTAGSTYGPIWPFTLGWLHRLGMPLTLPIAHVLNALVTCAACVALAHTLWRRWSLVLSVIVVAPIVIHWTKGFYNQDYYSLNTEVLPFALLVAGCLVSFPRGPISARRAVAGAALLGSVVWSKYSFVFIVAVALVALISKMLESGHDLRPTLLTCVAVPPLPLLLLIGWALLYGVPWWKITETFSFTSSYFSEGGLHGQHSSISQRYHDVRLTVMMFRSMLPIAALLGASLLVGVAHHVRARAHTAQRSSGQQSAHRRTAPQHSSRWSSLPHANITRALAVLSVLASFVSLGVLSPIYPHYSYLFIAGVFQAGFLLASLEPAPEEKLKNVQLAAVAVTAAIALWALGPILERDELPLYGWSRAADATTTWRNVFSTSGARWDRILTKDGQGLSTLCPFRSKVLVWGWSPDLYSQYDWQPASRYVDTYGLVALPTLSAEAQKFRARLLDDFRAEQPRCVVDAANAVMFPSWGPNEGLESQWPQFATELGTGYTRTTVFVYGTVPMTVWVRNT